MWVGSTPSPPRRIRQHNGELTQGAWKTSRFRPWEMQMIVHGFPSKLSALQFEWAWQKPELSRHVAGQFKKDAKRNWMERKVAVCRALLRSPFFSRLPLRVRCFTEKSHDAFNHLEETLPGGCSVTLDVDGVGRLDLDDALRMEAWEVYQEGVGGDCKLCRKPAPSNQLELAICPNHDCRSQFHLDCLAKHHRGSSLLPRNGPCPSCQKNIEWGEVIRGSYGRKAGEEGTMKKPKRVASSASQS